MKTIPLTQGQVAFVDDSDFARVSKYNWHIYKDERRLYAARMKPVSEGRGREMMHRFLWPERKRIDHKDGNGLNNQSENTRPCTPLQNNRAFKLKRKGASSLYRGVSRYKKSKWAATITVEKRYRHLGVFSSQTEAAHAYDVAARQYFGDFACPNFP